MSQQPQHKNTETVVDSYETEADAWEQAAKFAQLLTSKGLAGEMGIAVKRVQGVYWLVLVKRTK